MRAVAPASSQTATLCEIARFGTPGGEVYFEDVLAGAVLEGDRVEVLDRRP